MMATAPLPGEIEDAPEEPILGNAHWLAQFTKEERKEILTLDDRKSVLTLVINWGVTFGAMAMVGASSGLWLLLTIPLALFVIAGRQLGCAIVMHEAAHRSFLSNRLWNDRIGNWTSLLLRGQRRSKNFLLPHLCGFGTVFAFYNLCWPSDLPTL